MQTEKRKLGRAFIKACVFVAKTKLQIGDDQGALSALQPLIDDVAAQVASDHYGPEPTHEEWFDLGPELINLWRQAIIDWRAEEFTGLTPGRRALVALCRDRMETMQVDLDDEHVSYRGTTPMRFMRSICAQVFGKRGHLDDLVAEAVEAEVRIAWADQSAHWRIPQNLFTELAWVPGWDGECLDQALEDLALSFKNFPANDPICDVRPNQAWANVLSWLNIGTEEIRVYLRDEVSVHAARRFAEHMGDIRRQLDPTRKQLLRPKQLVAMLDNASYRHLLPVVYAEVNVAALYGLDPREPISLALNNGKGFAAGFHDPINGAGYVDVWPGTVELPPLSTGIASSERFHYGIARTYDLVQRYFQSTPRTLEPVKQAA